MPVAYEGSSSKEFWFIFSTGSDMQAAKFIIKTVRSDKSVLRINSSKVMMAPAMRRTVT
jgi:hypothetical protein